MTEPGLVKLTLQQDVQGMRALLAAGADVNVRSKGGGRRAIYWAATLPSTGPLQVLIEHGAKVNLPPDEEAPLLRAISTGKLLATRMLLDAGADPNTQAAGRTALMFIAATQHHEVASLLINRGADLHATDNSGDQAVHIAARNRNPETLAALLRCGADKAARSARGTGKTPLELAAENRSVRGVETLLEAGALVPEVMQDQPYWDNLYDCIYTNRQEHDFLAVQRLVRAAILAQRLGTAMDDAASEPVPSRHGPSPL